MIKKPIIVIFCYCILYSCSPSGKQDSSKTNNPSENKELNYIKEFREYVNSTKGDTLYPGAAIVIVKDTSVLYITGLGVKKIGTTDSVNVHTIFRLASVSKGFAGVLAAIFVQKGLLHWDDKVIKYLPDFKLHTKASTDSLTIREVLDQTTGLPTHTYTNMIESRIKYNVLRDKLKDVPLSGLPGKEHTYQNVAYSLIADVLEKISGKPYEELLKENIFIPFGMTDASASYEPFENSNNHAFPHATLKNGFLPVKNSAEYYTVLPAAGVNASISDMGKYLIALMGNKPDIINSTHLHEIFSPQVVTPRRRKYFFMRWLPVKKTFYGLGWRVIEYNNDTMVYHGGHVNGFRAEIALIPKHKIGIAVICNAPGKFINTAIPTFFDMYYKYED